jgi:hypothetical protein
MDKSRFKSNVAFAAGMICLLVGAYLWSNWLLAPAAMFFVASVYHVFPAPGPTPRRTTQRWPDYRPYERQRDEPAMDLIKQVVTAADLHIANTGDGEYWYGDCFRAMQVIARHVPPEAWLEIEQELAECLPDWFEARQKMALEHIYAQMKERHGICDIPLAWPGS